MSSTTTSRRPRVHRLGLAGIGTAVLLVGIATPAGAATDVVIPLEPAGVLLEALPLDPSGDPMDPMDPAPSLLIPVPVQYSGTLAVEIPAWLDSTAVEAQLSFDDDGDPNTADVTYTSELAPTDPFHLAIADDGAGTIEVALPADDNAGVDEATLLLEPLTTTLGEPFSFVDPATYFLDFGDAAAPAAQTVGTGLLAISQVPCDVRLAERCAFPTPVTAGSTVTLDLTTDSVLRELGITDLTGVLVALQALDADGLPSSTAPAELEVQVSGSTATFVVPADLAAGSYGLVVAQPTAAGGSVVSVELAVVAEPEPAVVPPPAEPTTPAAPTTTTTTVNAGLRSNTGVEAVETGSSGTAAVVTGAGLLLAASVGGVAVARTRRRPAVEGGTCGA
jgi:hypothetical protein